MKKGKCKIIKKLKENPWMLSTVVLGLLLLVGIIFSGIMMVSGDYVSTESVGEDVVAFLNVQTGGGVELVSVGENYGLYEVVVSYQDQEIPVYATKDGKNLVQGVTPLVTEITQTEPEVTEVSKLETPVADLYIWSYCPYGVTALKPFAQVAQLLGSSANFNVYLYYAGHGDFEVQQNKIQACIQDLGYENEYWQYAISFVDGIYEQCYGDAACDLEKSTELMGLVGIDSASVFECVDSKGEELLEAHYNAAKEVGVTGSPSLLINGAKVSVARTSEAYKSAVCEGFLESPSECEVELSSDAVSSSGSC